MRISSIMAAAAILAGAGAAHGAVVSSFEAAGVQTSTVHADNVETDTFPTDTAASVIGAYSGQLSVVPADQYGGAGGTGYYIETAPGGNDTFTLTLNKAANYFGLWISALDAGNTMTFYNGATAVGSFSASDVPANFYNYGAGYDHNPNGSQPANYGQPYFFVNFSDTTGTFDSVVFTENGTTFGNFEMDNLTAGLVPEPATWAMMVLGAGLLGAGLRFTRQGRGVSAA